MGLGEFDLIERYFAAPHGDAAAGRADVPLGIGDDAALLCVPAGMQLVAALDTLVEGRHFPADSPPASTGHRALAVNLSDLAAMGASPAWFLLSLTLPAADETFLEPFAAGLRRLAMQHGVALVGGDTTAGPLTIAVQALGLVEPGTALLRSGGRAGDLLFVSGTPGDAAAGLRVATGGLSGGTPEQRRVLLERFQFPQPRVALGRALRGIASACIDVSDGLAADALKLAAASGCGLRMEAGQLPVSAALRAVVDAGTARELALNGGDDYELCFTVPPGNEARLRGLPEDVKCGVTCIGRLEQHSGLRLFDGGVETGFAPRGFDHFP